VCKGSAQPLAQNLSETQIWGGGTGGADDGGVGVLRAVRGDGGPLHWAVDYCQRW
jgi:hypothetical protein